MCCKKLSCLIARHHVKCLMMGAEMGVVLGILGAEVLYSHACRPEAQKAFSDSENGLFC